MRLLFVGTNRGPGGTESHFVSLARAMADAGHEVSAVVWPDEVIHQALAADGRIAVHPARFRRRYDLCATRDVVRACRSERPDWLVGTFKHEYWGVAAAAHAVDRPAIVFNHLDQRFHPLMLRMLPRLVERIVVPSRYLQQRFTERGVCPTRTTVLPNPVDTRHFHACPEARRRSREALGFAPDDVVVGFVGRIEPEKGVHVLARALDRVMADCPRVRALWVGHGRSWDELRAATAAGPHAARHRWHGWSADVFPLYAAMDLLALPSVGPETFGRVLVEAQACGVPVLGSALGGIPEALEPGITGLLLPPGDVDAWTSAVAELAEDPRRRSFMGWAGRRFVCGQFESGQIASRFGALLAAGAAALSA